MGRWEKGRTEGWGGDEGGIGNAEGGLKTRRGRREKGDRGIGREGFFDFGFGIVEWGSRNRIKY